MESGNGMKSVNVESIESSIAQLERYLDREDIEAIQPLLAALRALGAEPGSESRFADLASAFDAVGSRQGAVITYAPYIGILLSDDPFLI